MGVSDCDDFSIKMVIQILSEVPYMYVNVHIVIHLHLPYSELHMYSSYSLLDFKTAQGPQLTMLSEEGERGGGCHLNKVQIMRTRKYLSFGILQTTRQENP